MLLNRKNKKENKYKIRLYYRPGLYLDKKDCNRLVREIRDTAGTCFDEIPEYQVMKGTRDELIDKVIAVAWRRDNKIAGFCSTVLLPVSGVGEVLHLGLTCVRPEDRKGGLTHILSNKALSGYIMRRRPFSRVWISNCACVLSSLGNVALHPDNVYPSPFAGNERPSSKHLKIALAINDYYRDKLYIRNESKFDADNFIFRGSVKDNVFQKSADDEKYFHRKLELNNYYRNMMDFRNGDEVLQIGHASVLTALKHLFRRKKTKKRPPQQTSYPKAA